MDNIIAKIHKQLDGDGGLITIPSNLFCDLAARLVLNQDEDIDRAIINTVTVFNGKPQSMLLIPRILGLRLIEADEPNIEPNTEVEEPKIEVEEEV